LPPSDAEPGIAALEQRLLSNVKAAHLDRQ
jgi:hypothetical protein